MVNKYKSLKDKLLRNKASIWFKKQCKTRHLIPKYTQTNVGQATNAARKPKLQQPQNHRINLEIKFLYTKKLTINFQLYQTHLQCARE